jgi:hypothetical protein
MQKITVPGYPRFMFTADQERKELYIVCTRPLALIWVRQTTPGQLYIVEGEPDADILKEAADWYRSAVASQLPAN